MQVKEVYTHTRNYGCRIRNFSMNDMRMVSMENKYLKVVFALDKGADIVELVYKPEDLDFMWHSFNELKNARQVPTIAGSKGNFQDGYAGGWQDLFPTYGRPTVWNGAEIGQHGEASVVAWECQVLEDTPECVSLKLSVRLPRCPFLLEKVVSLTEEAAALSIHEKITNLGNQEYSFMWGQHPAFGWPFIDEHTRLRVKGNPTLHMSLANNPYSLVEAGETGVWPAMKGKNGEMVAMDRAYAHEDKISMEYGLSNLEEGAYELVNTKLGIGIRMEFDKEIYPNLWIWAMYCGYDGFPWFGRAYTMAVEPWSCRPANYEKAMENGTAHKLQPGKSMETDLKVEVILEQK